MAQIWAKRFKKFDKKEITLKTSQRNLFLMEHFSFILFEEQSLLKIVCGQIFGRALIKSQYTYPQVKTFVEYWKTSFCTFQFYIHMYYVFKFFRYSVIFLSNEKYKLGRFFSSSWSKNAASNWYLHGLVIEKSDFRFLDDQLISRKRNSKDH